MIKKIEADMHMHSCYSDGYYEPREIIKKAKAIGLIAISLTDHDVYQGLYEFETAAQEFKIDFLPGIEITSKYKGVDVHILGYGFDYSRKKLLENRLKKQWMAGNIRAKQILKKYADSGLLKATINDIRSETNCRGPVVSIMNIRDYRMKISKIPIEQIKKEVWRGGIAWADFNEKYLMTPIEAVAFINEIGGISILAHPGEFCHRTNKTPRGSLLILFEILDQLQKFGLAGIEAFYPKHTEKQTELFIRLAKTRNLLITGGSDYHGKFKSHISLGMAGINYDYFLKLKEICKYKK